jgi:hypothetical protein
MKRHRILITLEKENTLLRKILLINSFCVSAFTLRYDIEESVGK